MGTILEGSGVQSPSGTGKSSKKEKKRGTDQKESAGRARGGGKQASLVSCKSEL